MTAPRRLSVLIPRPSQAAAARTALLLRQSGFAPFILPLSRVTALPFAAPLLSSQPYAAVLATSAHAFLPFSPPAAPAPPALKTLPLYCVGRETAQAAQNCGFGSLRHTAETAAGLCRFLADMAAKTENRPHFLYLAGKPRRPDLEQFLTAAKMPHTVLETYQTVAQPVTQAALAALPPVLDAVLLYSAFTAAQLPLLNAHIGAQTRLLCLSARIAAATAPQWRAQTQIAAQPNQKALLALLPPSGG